MANPIIKDDCLARYMYMNQEPLLFGLQNTNRNFSTKADWGKNVFNNAFPASLVCYMNSIGLDPVYLTLNSDLRVDHGNISATDLFSISPTDSSAFFAFESLYMPYEQFVTSTLPRIDLVVCSTNSEGLIDKSLRGIEIKLTALPDNSTADMPDEEYGSEIVVRPDTIVYLALSIATNYHSDREKLRALLEPVCSTVSDWNDPIEIRGKIGDFKETIDAVLLDRLDLQEPFVLQPVWKTKGKTLELESNCLDAFVWSDYGFTRLFVDNLQAGSSSTVVKRPMRALVWLIKMLYEYSLEGHISHVETTKHINFGYQTDKAFAMSGRVTRKYLKSPELLNPRVEKAHLRNIILNGGHLMLSPERRFDAAIMSNFSLFE